MKECTAEIFYSKNQQVFKVISPSAHTHTVRCPFDLAGDMKCQLKQKPTD
jgi:hypothetical protein